MSVLIGPGRSIRPGYVVKRYPRYSETFIVNEILAHERAGLELEIFALYPPSDTHFQDAISRVRAPVTWVTADGLRGLELWRSIREAEAIVPHLWAGLKAGVSSDVRVVYQAVRIATTVVEHGIDHLHAHFATSATDVARLAAGMAGIPYSFTAHAKDIFHESVADDDLRQKLRDAAAVVTVSEFNRNHLRQRFGPAADRVCRIYNGLDLSLFAFRGNAPRTRTIISVGRLVEKKGFCHLIEACAILASRGVELDCVIIGTGELEEDLREQIDSSGLGTSVRLIGPRPQKEVIDLVANASVFAGPYVVGDDGNRDGLPTVLVEAMALGTACVSTDVTGVPEVIEHGVTGMLVGQRDPVALANAIERLLLDDELRNDLAIRARARIERDFDILRNAAHLRSVFDAAVADRTTLEAG